MPPKLIFENVFDQFKEFATKLLDEIAEPRSLILVVDWQIGQTDFPPGLIVTREGTLGPQFLIEASGQLTTMNLRVLDLYVESATEAKEMNSTLMQQVLEDETRLQQLQQEIEELEQRKLALQGETTD